MRSTWTEPQLSQFLLKHLLQKIFTFTLHDQKCKIPVDLK